MTAIEIKILQGSAVTQNALGGLNINSLFANFLLCLHAKSYTNRSIHVSYERWQSGVFLRHRVYIVVVVDFIIILESLYDAPKPVAAPES